MPNLPWPRRRLGALALALAAPALGRARAQLVALRVTHPGTGAGVVWKPLLEALPAEQREGIEVQWVSGNPGQMQVQLLTGALDVGVYGATGLAEAVARGADIVIFGPALNNHGR
jgi:ABC-type nitrate/sulfonate/bicarbonate transport system substrate-binding protein